MKKKIYPRLKNLNQKLEDTYPEEFLARYAEIKTQVQGNGLHIPIMTKEILFYFWETFANEQGPFNYFDGTFGRGGHYTYLKALFPNLKAFVFDQDGDAFEFAQKNFSRELQNGELQFFKKSFHSFNPQEFPPMDMMLLDLGVSSPQLDQGARGFSFSHDGPLDMRMDQSQEITAADLLQVLTEEQLNQIFQKYGEIKRPFRVVRAIVHDRKEKKYESTSEFAKMIERVDGWRIKGFHPATQYFMALRLYLNREIEGLESSLPLMMKALRDKGRFQILTFHSLEDRVVKTLFKESDLGETNKKIVAPSEEETQQNPRSRSAKLRIFTRSEKDFTHDEENWKTKKRLARKYPSTND